MEHGSNGGNVHVVHIHIHIHVHIHSHILTHSHSHAHLSHHHGHLKLLLLHGDWQHHRRVHFHPIHHLQMCLQLLHVLDNLIQHRSFVCLINKPDHATLILNVVKYYMHYIAHNKSVYISVNCLYLC
ncbi:hypothetical protein V8G54_009136 [Vigna mungo]|uniref:Uncharacterized protein n=1 Tax=Vigna mungo TaxID=3915 RepID=A0AAQ3NU76_VIGMU